MGKIYDESGWLNAPWLYDICKGFLRIVGSRGTGKSYGFLKEVVKRGDRFIYLRRTQRQLENCMNPSDDDDNGNPFTPLNNDLGWSIHPYVKRGKMFFATSAWNEAKQRNEPDAILGIGLALSTLGNIRSVDYSTIKTIIFDEFIADVNDRPIKNEFAVFMNLIETVNRNRELKGEEPVKVIMLGNANKLANPYFVGWHLMKTVLHMIAGQQMMHRTPDGTGITVIMLDSPIAAQKAKTMLYKNASADFVEMALNNAFRTDETNVKSWPLRECLHIVSVGDIGIYQHKSNGYYYVSETVNKNNFYDDYGVYLLKFRRQYCLFRDIYLRGLIYFENFEVELIFREYLNLTD